MRAREARHEIAGRVLHRRQQRGRNSWRQRDAKRVTIAGGVFHRDVSEGSADGHGEDTSRLHELSDGGVGHSWLDACLDLVAAQVANLEQQVVHGVGTAGATSVIEMLQLQLDRRHLAGIHQITQLGVADELAQL